MRPQLQKFAEIVEAKLKVRDERYGNGAAWREYGYAFVLTKFYEEIGEYEEDFNPKELVDIAACCMMLYDLHNRLEE